ncbi:ATP-binding cassette domain-containing protein [Microcella daejeonensis]|uniref:ATP-binding cassette domain-containing protein n=1 Tax=Microcella daejeonensis TaxID=2994971 RepID=UPI003983EA48
MDEPTASLGPEDVARLHEVIRELRGSGHAVIYVSHDLDAVLDICDAVTVLREGEVVQRRPTGEWTKKALIKAMLGGVEPRSARSVTTPRTARTVALRVRGLRAPGVQLDALDIEVGEIVGIAGLVGSGRTRLLRALAGALPVQEGLCEIGGKPRSLPRTPVGAWRMGIAMAPEDRKDQGLVLDQSAAWNIALGDFSRASGRGPVTLPRIVAGVRSAASTMSFAASRLRVPAGTLSGGNQQKLMLARLMNRPVSVLLLDEPTRGIDIGAKSHVFTALREIAESGRSVIWSSSEIEEVLAHSDRILVVAGGRVIDELPPHASPHDVLTRIFDFQRTADVRATDGGSAP